MTEPVPFVDLKRQFKTIEADIRSALERVLDSQIFIMGPEVAACENKLAEYLGASFGIGVSSGTDALLAALMGLDIGYGDEVIVPSFSFFATAGAVVRVGATPIFVDIDPVTFNLDVEHVRQSITDKTRAVIPVHLFGQSADLGRLLIALDGMDIAIIEDAAQAIGTRYKDKHVGTYGTVGCFSFFPAKNLGAFGDGGLIVTDNADLAERIKLMRAHGAKPKYHHEVIGGNFRLDAIQAAVIGAKLPYLDIWNDKRREHANYYDNVFRQENISNELLCLPKCEHGRHSYNQYVIRSPKRDALEQHLKENGIGCQIYYPEPLHRQPCFKSLVSADLSLPHTEKAVEEVLALPVFPELTQSERGIVSSTVINFFQQFG